jgi:photosystem II stability/assembly factor-like uncharacterized protein
MSLARVRCQAQLTRLSLICLLALSLATAWFLLSPAVAPACISTGDGGWFWQNPLPQGNDLHGVSFVDAGRGWAVGARGTILHTTDGGADWQTQRSGTNAWLDGVAFADATHGWAVGDIDDEITGATTRVILATSDGGAHWNTQLSETANGLNGVSFPDASHGWAVGWSGTILTTSDGGAHWNTQDSGTSDYFYAVDFVDASHGWAVGESGLVLATADGGATWSVQDSDTHNDLWGVSFCDASHGWAVGSGSTIVATTDGGTHWRKEHSGVAYGLNAVSFSDANHGCVVGWRTILTTSDGGSSWAVHHIASQVGLAAVDCPDASHGWAVGDAGRILVSTDGGAHWGAQSSGTYDGLYAIDFADVSHGWAVGWGFDTSTSAILATQDGGSQWGVQDSGPGDILLDAVDFADASHGCAVGYNLDTGAGTILTTTDGGLQWSSRDTGALPKGSQEWLTGVAVPDASHGWAVGYRYDSPHTFTSVILATSDGGAHWSPQSPGTQAWLEGVCFVDVEHGWTVGVDWTLREGVVLVTTDGGAHWVAQSPGIRTSLNAVDFVDANHGWAVGGGGTILVTTDGGADWHAQSSGTTDTLYGVRFVDASHGWAVGDEGIVLATSDGGATWEEQNSGTTNMLHGVSFPDARHGWAVGDDCSILATATGGSPDSTPPVTVDDAPSGWLDHGVTVGLSASDAGSGVAFTGYSLDDSTTWTRGTSVTIPAPADHSNDGLHTILYYSVDNAGNTEATKSCTVKIDTTLPTTADDYDGLWHNSPVAVDFAATDPNLPDASGVTSTEYSLDGGTTWTQGTSVTILAPADHTGDGLHTILYRSTDNAGNTEKVDGCTVKIDTTPPVISFACLSLPHHHHHSGWATHRSAIGRGHHANWRDRSRYRSRLSLTYRIDDNLSPTVAVGIELLSFRGKVLQTISLGQHPTGVLQVYRLPGTLAHGFSRLRLTATDLAGNRQSKLVG